MKETKCYLLRKDVTFKDAHEFKNKFVLESYNDEDYVYIEQDEKGLITVVYFYDENNSLCQVLDCINNEREVNYLWSSCTEYYCNNKESLEELRQQIEFENFPFFFFHSSDSNMKVNFQYLVQRAREAILLRNQQIKQQ